MYEDMVNCVNFIVGCINMSNFCLEILQVNSVLEYDENFDYICIGYDIFCNLGLLNIVYIMDFFDFVCMVEIVVCGLMVVLDMSYICSVLFIEVGNVVLYVIGLGQMNLYGYLV